MTPSVQSHTRPNTWPWWVWVWGGNALFLGAAFAVKAQWTGNLYIRKLAPNWEYTLGNWWSGMLLLCFAGLLAGAAQDSSNRRTERRAMLILSWVGLVLCLDELGSLHERANDLMPMPPPCGFVPFALLLAMAAGGSLWVLCRDDGRRRRFCLTALLGFVCLGLGEPYDMIEHGMTLPDWYVPTSVVVEEGIELLGGTLLIWAGLQLRSDANESLPRRDGDDCRATIAAGLRRLGVVILLSVVPLVALRLALQRSADLDLHTRGDFGAAPSVMIFALVGWGCALRATQHPDSRGLLRQAAALLSLVISVELGCNMLAWITSESVISPTGVWPVQITAAVLGYGWLLAATRTKT